mgnify:CR=1 FL=1
MPMSPAEIAKLCVAIVPSVTQADIDKQKKEFFANGGVIEKVPILKREYSTLSTYNGSLANSG